MSATELAIGKTERKVGLFTDEEEMRAPVNRWIRSQRWEPVNEYCICHRRPDVVGIEGRRVMVAVEMKLSDWRAALGQAHIYRFFAERSYVAMPSNKQRIILRNIGDFNALGVGVLIVRGDSSVIELLRPVKFDPPFSEL